MTVPYELIDLTHMLNSNRLRHKIAVNDHD